MRTKYYVLLGALCLLVLVVCLAPTPTPGGCFGSNCPVPTEATPTSPPPETAIPTITPPPPPQPSGTPTTGVDKPTETPFVEPSPTIGKPPGDGEDQPDPSPTWDCFNNWNGDHCLTQTGGGIPVNYVLGVIGILGFILVGMAIIAHGMRTNGTGTS